MSVTPYHNEYNYYNCYYTSTTLPLLLPIHPEPDARNKNIIPQSTKTGIYERFTRENMHFRLTRTDFNQVKPSSPPVFPACTHLYCVHTWLSVRQNTCTFVYVHTLYSSICLRTHSCSRGCYWCQSVLRHVRLARHFTKGCWSVMCYACNPSRTGVSKTLYLNLPICFSLSMSLSFPGPRDESCYHQGSPYC